MVQRASPGEVVLVAGASGVIGRALVPKLAEHPRVSHVRALGRRREALPIGPNVEPFAADASDPDALRAALRGVTVVYYLVHALERADFHARNVTAARELARAAQAADVRRIVYLGALSGGTSPHLADRRAVGDALRTGTVPVTELGAAAVIGADSLVFELVRHLVERMPVVPCPSGCHTRTQPIALDDAVRYLVASMEEPQAAGAQLDIGGDEVLSYREMMALYARIAGLRRAFVDLPIEVRAASAAWIGLVSPVSKAMAHQLVRGMGDELVLRNSRARSVFRFEHIPMDVAFRRAIAAARPVAPAPWSALGVRALLRDRARSSWHRAR